MILVNKEMSWDEVEDTYGGLLIYVKNVKKKKLEYGYKIISAYVECVAETLDDREKMFDMMEKDVNEGYPTKPDMSKRRAEEHPELLVFEI